MRQYGLILAAMLAALAIGYWAGHGATPAAQSAHGTNTVAVAQATTTQKKIATVPAIPMRGVPGVVASPTPHPPLPAPNTPLKQTMAELQTRAAAGDAEAASRLYHDTQRCVRYRYLKTTVLRLAAIALADSANLGKQSPGNDEAFLSSVQKQLAFVRDNAAFCAELSDTDINEIVFPSAMQAALLGDTDAADCYVGQGSAFGIPPGLLDHPEWLMDYKRNALAIASAAIEKGDWTMVSQLGWAYEGVGSPLLQQVTGQDKALAYRYLKLGRLGVFSDGKDVQFLDVRLKTLADDLPTDVKTAADLWAQDAFQHYFAATPQNPAYNSFRICRPDAF